MTVPTRVEIVMPGTDRLVEPCQCRIVTFLVGSRTGREPIACGGPKWCHLLRIDGDGMRKIICGHEGCSGIGDMRADRESAIVETINQRHPEHLDVGVASASIDREVPRCRNVPSVRVSDTEVSSNDTVWPTILGGAAQAGAITEKDSSARQYGTAMVR
ncbi:hypothetical protein ACWDPV_02810 [Gordonia sp. NPDC003504]